MTTRWLKDAGLNPVIAYGLLTAGFIGLSFYLFHKTEFAPYLYLLLAWTVIGKLSDTRRSEFLLSCFGDRKFYQIRIIENLLSALPFAAFLLYQQRFVYSAGLLASALLLACIKIQTTYRFTLWTPFAKKPFEFPIGFRNTFLLIVAAYALTVIAVTVNNFNLGLFALALIWLSTLSYYTKPEPEYYVWIHQQTPRQFLWHKIKIAMLLSSWLALPVVFVMGIFFYTKLGILALAFPLGWAFLVGTILSKYAAYPDELNIVQGILLALCFSFPPILLIAIPFLFKKSEQQLSRLLV